MNYFSNIIKHYITLALDRAGVAIDSDTHVELQGAMMDLDQHIKSLIKEAIVDTPAALEVQALVEAVSSLLDTAHREYEGTDWTVSQWIADEPTVAALDAALDPFRVSR